MCRAAEFSLSASVAKIFSRPSPELGPFRKIITGDGEEGGESRAVIS